MNKVEGEVEREARPVEHDLDREARPVEREAKPAEHDLDRFRVLAEGIARRLGGHPAVVRVQIVLDTYDRAGGGLVAGGLAYTSLLAILPGMLLGLSIIGYLIRDPATQQQIVAFISEVLPPFKELATTAFDTVSNGAVPSSIIAIIGLLWGASRLYANVDTAFSRIFSGAPRRNPVVQTIRGVALTIVFVALPIGLVLIGSLVSWLSGLAPEWFRSSRVPEALLELASPLGSLIAFVVAVVLCYRFVPSERVSWRALLLPAGVMGLILTVLTQIYAFIAPRLVGAAAIYGAFVALFGLLAWLSIAFNILLIGAAWTDTRQRVGPLLAIRGGAGEQGSDAAPGEGL